MEQGFKMETLITLENVSKEYPHRDVLKNISFGINDGDRIGLIGVNGTGKSTLLKCLAGEEEADEGRITKNGKLRIAYLPQTPVFDNSKSVLDNVVEGKRAEEEYINLRGQARTLLLQFGIENPDDTAEHLSGGTKKRAALVRTILTPSNFLILDEPTNHLDSDMTEWLENFLKGYKGAFIMITHDRYFLDRTVNKMIELDQGKIYEYVGANYSKYLEMKAEREEIALSTEHKNQNLYRIELAWMQRGARARTTKQKAHIERFNELANREKPVITDDEVKISTLSSRLGKKTIILDHISKSFGEKQVIKDFSYTLLSDDRIGIIGKNGCGKSTLLKLITGLLQPDTGKVETGITVKAGFFLQENEELPQNERVIDYIRETADYIKSTDGVITASQMLEKFLFSGAAQYGIIGKLSGGEKRRLFLLHVLMQEPNILILDEPTNDLDIKTLTILENYLKSFPGIVISVSHDRYFLDKMANRIFSFEGNGIIKQYEGGYSDYRLKKEVEDEKELFGELSGGKKRGKEGKAEANGKGKAEAGAIAAENQNGSKKASEGEGREEGKAKEGSEEGASWNGEGTSEGRENWSEGSGSWNKGSAGGNSRHEKKVRFSYKEEREFETIDSDIEKLEAELAEVEAGIVKEASNYPKLSELSKRKEELETKLEEKMERWEYLSELNEKIQAQKKN